MLFSDLLQDERERNDGVEQLVAKCHALGLTMRRAPKNEVTHVAVTLQPMKIRRIEFDALCQLQLLWNEAVDNTARDFAYLRDVLRETATSDTEFTGKLVNILQVVYLAAEPYQKLMLGIFRADYMHSESGGDDDGNAEAWKNVEINTISCSFAGLSPLVTDFHQHIEAYQRALHGANGNSSGEEKKKVEGEGGTGDLLRSASAKVVPEALAAAVLAWSNQQHFDSLRSSYDEPQSGRQRRPLQQPVVLIIVQEKERNTGDQYALQLELLEAHGILSLRRTLQELHNCMELHSVPGEPPLALVDGRYPVAVAYFRSTYVPADLPTVATWNTRLAIERSSAIKCPSVPYHLLTFKKLQQLLCDVDNVLVPIAFRGDATKARRLQRHFMPQYSLNPVEVGETAVERIIDEVVQHPERFVLKPQLEGGGNLLSGETMRGMLQLTREVDPVGYSKIRREYILMSRINFQVHSGALLVDGKVVRLEDNLCSELGIYGVILSDGDGAKHRNACAGYTVRSKAADVDGGGVMVGVAALDSLTLV